MADVAGTHEAVERTGARPERRSAALGFRILGPLEVRAGGRPIEIAAAKPRAVLAILLLHANAVVPTDRLIEEIWGERAERRLRHTLQVYVSQLRKLLAPAGVADRIVTRGTGYLLQVGPGELDRDRFERLLAEGSRAFVVGDSAAAAERLRGALSLWRGPALADFAYEPFAQAEIARLEELRLQALETRIEVELALGRDGDLVGELEALVAEEPLRERLRGHLMLALYRAGRQAEALDAYRKGRRFLVDELGIEPGPALQLLQRRILAHDETLAAPATRAPRRAPVAPRDEPPPAPGEHPTNLPPPPTPLVGRTRELAELRELLLSDDVRVLTLTGAGGSGKTRLAVELAASLEEGCRDGVFLVTLGVIADPRLVPVTIAQTLGAPERAGRSLVDSLIDHLADKQLVLLLDNFEQMLDAAPELARIVAAAPGVKVLVTSRVCLSLPGEHEYEVPPLSLPDRGCALGRVSPQSDATALFLERARAARAGIPATQADAAIAEICVRLDGLPLAIELAAARAGLLSPEAIAKRLGRRVPQLTPGPRDLVTRQRILRATIDWTHSLLDERDRRLFARLAVFAGGFTFHAAASVCQADPDTLADLADKGLLQRQESTPAGPRLALVEPIREYALERLEARRDAEEVRARHARYFLALVREAERAHFAGASQAAWLHRLNPELDNLRAALAWSCRTHRGGIALPLAVSLRYWSSARGRLRDGRTRLAEAVARGRCAPSLPRPSLLREVSRWAETAAAAPFPMAVSGSLPRVL
jgi:predicted ATPase/DNA-binding SARP family transcriptional activator